MPGLGRRRFIQIAAGATLLAGHPAMAGPAHSYKWRGRALGAEAEITLHLDDRDRAREIVHKAREEIRRLEAIFSLYDENSTLRQLNRDGEVSRPPLELVSLLSEAEAVSRRTDGVFDVSVQPYWDLFRRGLLDRARLMEVSPPIDYRNIRVSEEKIAFGQSGMAITLNGIAQGYITDRVTDLLRMEGVENVLVNLGEFSALGAPQGLEAWKIGLSGDGEDVFDRVALSNRAMATSAPRSIVFHPKTGMTEAAHEAVAVLADRAVEADGLSTAFLLMETAEIEPILAAEPRLGMIALGKDGTITRLGMLT